MGRQNRTKRLAIFPLLYIARWVLMELDLKVAGQHPPTAVLHFSAANAADEP